jgi:hypothetical protein
MLHTQTNAARQQQPKNGSRKPSATAKVRQTKPRTAQAHPKETKIILLLLLLLLLLLFCINVSLLIFITTNVNFA